MTEKESLTPAVEEARLRRDELRFALGTFERATTAALAGPGWTAGVRSGLDQLAGAFDNHVVVTEGFDGLYAEILERAPRLARAVERLREEHGELHRMIQDVKGRMSAGELDEAAREEVREVALALLAAFVRHRHRGADLVYEAYNLDIGAGD
ncbi:MAG: hypothetical protein M5U14_04680 [Acidimicrobiia bacterium]|nr:hypothetical protein [Acidimicrobiia bacterium]